MTGANGLQYRRIGAAAYLPETPTHRISSPNLTSVFSSVAGLLGFLIAAWVMPQSEVGRATEFVSAMQLIGGAAQLNLGIGIMRWLPGAGRKSVRLVFGSLLLIMPLSGLAGLLYGLVVPRIAMVAAGDGPFAWGLVLLVLGCAGWGVFVVHDFVMVTAGRPWLAVWRSGSFAVTRIILLGVLGAGLASQGMVLSWVIPVVLWVGAGTVVLWIIIRNFAATGVAVLCQAGRKWLGSLDQLQSPSLVPFCCIIRFHCLPTSAWVTPSVPYSLSRGRRR